jgi:hypothetical protein
LGVARIEYWLIGSDLYIDFSDTSPLNSIINRPALMLLSAKSPYWGAGEWGVFEECKMCLTTVFIRGRARDSRSIDTTLNASAVVEDSRGDGCVCVPSVVEEESGLSGMGGVELLVPLTAEGVEATSSCSLTPDVSERERFLDCA